MEVDDIANEDEPDLLSDMFNLSIAEPDIEENEQRLGNSLAADVRNFKEVIEISWSKFMVDINSILDLKKQTQPSRISYPTLSFHFDKEYLRN